MEAIDMAPILDGVQQVLSDHLTKLLETLSSNKEKLEEADENLEIINRLPFVRSLRMKILNLEMKNSELNRQLEEAVLKNRNLLEGTMRVQQELQDYRTDRPVLEITEMSGSNSNPVTVPEIEAAISSISPVGGMWSGPEPTELAYRYDPNMYTLSSRYGATQVADIGEKGEEENNAKSTISELYKRVNGSWGEGEGPCSEDDEDDDEGGDVENGSEGDESEDDESDDDESDDGEPEDDDDVVQACAPVAENPAKPLIKGDPDDMDGSREEEEEEEEETEDEEEDDIEVTEITLVGKKYYLDALSCTVYEYLANEEVGEKIGAYKNGELSFFPNIV